FLFLATPGAVVAGVLTFAVAGAAGDRRRREQALLRARGASTGALVRLAGIEAVAVGVAGSAVGLLVAWWTTPGITGTSAAGLRTGSTFVAWGLAVVAGLAIAVGAV